MKDKLSSFLSAVVFLALASTAMATTWYVNGVSGSDSNSCTSATTACKTIGHAISLATSGGTIRVAAGTYTENLTISKSLKILGAGATTAIVDGGGLGRVFSITSGIAVTLSGMTIRHGGSSFGGGIANSGTLTIRWSTITGNIAFGSAGGVGGGLSNSGGGRLIISSSTISGNAAKPPIRCQLPCIFAGGGIFNNGGRLSINNSTIAGNSARTGGAIFSMNNGMVWINNSTVSTNSASGTGGIASGLNGGTATIQNSIFANNVGRNCFGTIASNGYNLSSDGTCPFTKTGDMNNTDPQLGPLQFNGGPTQTMALPSGSPAVDAGNPGGCTNNNGVPLMTDQRGAPRPDGEDVTEGKLGCDIGAYERQSD